MSSHNSSDNAIVRGLLNGNEIGVLLQFNSGLPINLPANLDLNGDGSTSDRPIGVARNALYLPTRKNVDLRYTRWIPIHGTMRAEIIAEMKNVFNTEQLSGVNTSTPVDAAGNPVAPISIRRVPVPERGRLRAAQVPARVPDALLTGSAK